MNKKKQLITGTIEENIKEALKQEEILRCLSPLDPYVPMAKNNIEYYLNCAAALERGETHITPKY